jgi:gluconolactonase
MTVEVRDPRLRTVVDPKVAPERLAGGFEFTEGPIWHPREQHLIFSDMPGDHMRRWAPGAGVTTFRRPSNMANGNAYDRAGRIVTCEHATSRLTRTGPDGRIEVLASHWQGKELNSPNDVVVRSDGWIYFSDPTFGRMEYYGLPRAPELTFRGVYRVLPETGTIELLADDFGQPNGLCFDLEERHLFVNDTECCHIRAFEVQADGRLGGSRIWAEPAGEGEGAPDGMKVDAAGNLFCTGPGGIHVFAPDAVCLGVIRLPEVAANFTWGDPDLCGLFVCASTSLYRVRLRTPGRPAF